MEKGINTYLCLLIMVLCFGLIKSEGQPSVDTKVGTIKGTTKTVIYRGHEYTVHRYLGIPYAKPPIGDRRFLKPEPADSFTEPFDATQLGLVCPQTPFPYMPTYKPEEMSEYCLFMNVYVPDQKPDGPDGHAVMVFLHGGGFAVGTGNTYSSNTLAAYGNVIVVTINYRLGFLGFASTDDDNAPGNLGLWDQRLVLQWVQQHIAAFGGDNSRVTIFGESAGSFSVTHQSFFPGNQGLFQRGILQSVSATLKSTIIPTAGTVFDFISTNLNCSTGSSKETVECVRKVDYSIILSTLTSLLQNPETAQQVGQFYPVVDNDFIKIAPSDLVSKHSIENPPEEVQFLRTLDLINGANSYEGCLFLNLLGVTEPDEFTLSREEINAHVPPILV